jgi:DNA-binding winged helix-turn-helix (wHTH) protein/TolB-like protein/cytochrome c-type biogenesis protein CcmH/NrfG
MGQVSVFRFGDFVLDGSQRRLLRSGEDVYLPPKTFELLLHLLQHRGRVLTKDELLEAVWPDVNVVENTLAQRIREIREALGDDAHGGRFIKTVPRVGYQFIADLDDEPPGVIPPPVLASLEAAPPVPIATQRDVGTNVPANQRQQLWRPVAIACVVLVGLIGAGYFVLTARPAQPPGSPAVITSIAVLPFKPLVAEDRDASLELGMTDSLIMKLGSLRQVTVRPLSAVRGYTDLAQDAVKAGKELRVESVLDGHVQRLQGRIRVSVSLRRVRDGQQLWADQFDEPWTNIFVAQDLVSQRVAEALALTLTGEEQRQLAKRYTENPEAYEAYVRGRYFWNTRTAEGYRKAVEDFQRAIRLDPGYSLAFSGLADAYNLLGSYGDMPMREAKERAKAAAQKAVDLDDQVAEAHTSLGAIIAGYDWEWAKAERHFLRAIDLKPRYTTAHEWYSEYLSWMGRHDKAIRAARQALDVDPVSLSANSHVGLTLYRARQYDAAIERFRETLHLDRDFADAHVMLGVTLVQKGMYGEAIAAFQRAGGLTGNSPEILGLLGYGYGMAGMKREAQDVLKELDDLSAQNRYVSSFAQTTIYIGLGETDLAFKWLEQAYQERLWYLALLAVDPLFDRLRGDARFTDLVRRMNLTAAAPKS